MRNLVILSLAIIMSFGTAFASSNSASEKSKVASTIGEIMKNAESLIDKEIVFIGMVQHVCAHSGRRAILLDETGKLSLRVEAKGEINGFNRELSGMDIRVKGILKERRLTSEFIDNWEAKVKAKQDAEEGGKHCASEMTNISQMRNWMKENGKEFYSIYYVDGLSYEIVD
ncbi:hypothetical protein L3073_02830 [Ancylomarina sp. DW003]|nr:hypothetical protein [Ancylomarina sp. DW003]MDE5421137.1 hypothetical protein [Ancylomarina sp. DW003]